MATYYDARQRPYYVNGAAVDELTCQLCRQEPGVLVRVARQELWARYERFIEARFMETNRWVQ